MIYQIYAGEHYGNSDHDFILECNEVYDIEQLESDFYKYHDKPKPELKYETKWYHATERFIHWLITTKGFRKPDVITLYTEG